MLRLPLPYVVIATGHMCIYDKEQCLLLFCYTVVICKTYLKNIQETIKTSRVCPQTFQTALVCCGHSLELPHKNIMLWVLIRITHNICFLCRTEKIILQLSSEPHHEKTVYAIREQQRRRSACASAQSDQSLRCALSG